MSAPPPALAPCQQNEHQSFRWMLTIELLMLCGTFLVTFIAFWNTCSSDSFSHRVLLSFLDSFNNVLTNSHRNYGRVLFTDTSTNFVTNLTNSFTNFLRSSAPLWSLILRSGSVTFWNTNSSDSYSHRVLRSSTNFLPSFHGLSMPLSSLILRSCSVTFWNTNSSDSYSNGVSRSFTNFLTNFLRPPSCIPVSFPFLTIAFYSTVLDVLFIAFYSTFLDVLFISLDRLFIFIANTPRVYRVIPFLRSIISNLSIPIITYILTVGDKAKATSPLFILSSIFLHLLFKTINTNKNNNLEARKHFPIEQVTGLCWIIFVLLTSGSKRNIPRELKVPTYVILGLSVCKVILRYVALRSASQSFAMGKNAKLVASYMTHHLPPETEQPVSEVEYSEAPLEFMSEYKYLVMGEEKQKIEPSKEGYHITLTEETELITLDKVWACEQLRDHDRNKELCLSFALFKLLRRKFEGFPLAESGSQSALRLLLHGPFKDHNRAFHIINVELSFLRDCLFSTDPLTCLGHNWFFAPFLCPLVLCYCVLIIIVSCKVARPSSHLHVYYKCLIMEEPVRNVAALFLLEGLLCLIILWLLFLMELDEFLNCLLSNWSKVIELCKHVKDPQLSRIRRIMTQLYESELNLLSKLSGCSSYNRLNQHSLLGRIERSVKVPDKVTEAIVRTLRDGNGRLTDGTASLNQNGVRASEFQAACKLDNHVERILVWHIATSHCEVQQTNSISTNLKAASWLSRYCAYLLTEVPELIQEDTEWTKLMVQAAVEQVCPRNHKHYMLHAERWFFCNYCMTFRRKQMASEEEGRTEPVLRLVKMGEELGARLITEIKDEAQRGKVLADLWAEMMLYMALSTNVEAHKNSLGNGGQFITHVWALLSHIGINERPSSELV